VLLFPIVVIQQKGKQLVLIFICQLLLIYCHYCISYITLFSFETYTLHDTC